MAGCGVLLAGCYGWTTAPSGVSAHQAKLHATLECSANTTTNPCQSYFEYWATGTQSHPQKDPTTPVVDNASFSGLGFTETTPDDLTAGTVYHYVICGKGDTDVTQTTCVGPNWNSGTGTPSSPPTTINATDNFVTADPTSTPPTQATIDYGRDTSTGETSNGVLYDRDGGQCAEYSTSPPKCLWFFGDDQVYKSTGADENYVKGSSAAIATFTPGKPTSVSLSEVDSPLGTMSGNGTYQFLNTSSLGNCPSPDYQARYVSAAAALPDTHEIEIFFKDACVVSGKYYYEDEGVALYDPTSNTFPLDPTIVFSVCPHGGCLSSTPLANLPTREMFNSAVSDGGELYFYSEDAAEHVYVARVTEENLRAPALQIYVWYQSNGTWSTDSTTAASIATTGVDTNQTIVANATSVNGDFVMTNESYEFLSVLVASKPWGPFDPPSGYSSGDVGRLPDSCVGGVYGCYAIVPHPELSTSTTLAYSWFSPDDGNGQGHIRIGTIPW